MEHSYEICLCQITEEETRYLCTGSWCQSFIKTSLSPLSFVLLLYNRDYTYFLRSTLSVPGDRSWVKLRSVLCTFDIWNEHDRNFMGNLLQDPSHRIKAGKANIIVMSCQSSKGSWTVKNSIQLKVVSHFSL